MDHRQEFRKCFSVSSVTGVGFSFSGGGVSQNCPDKSHYFPVKLNNACEKLLFSTSLLAHP